MEWGVDDTVGVMCCLKVDESGECLCDRSTLVLDISGKISSLHGRWHIQLECRSLFLMILLASFLLK